MNFGTESLIYVLESSDEEMTFSGEKGLSAIMRYIEMLSPSVL